MKRSSTFLRLAALARDQILSNVTGFDSDEMEDNATLIFTPSLGEFLAPGDPVLLVSVLAANVQDLVVALGPATGRCQWHHRRGVSIA